MDAKGITEPVWTPDGLRNEATCHELLTPDKLMLDLRYSRLGLVLDSGFDDRLVFGRAKRAKVSAHFIVTLQHSELEWRRDGVPGTAGIIASAWRSAGVPATPTWVRTLDRAKRKFVGECGATS